MTTLKYKSPITFDIIDNLPEDDNIPTPDEIHLMDKLFYKKHTTFSYLVSELKDIIILIFIFIIFSHSIIDNTIQKFIKPANNSFYILIGIKAICFAITCHLVKKYIQK